MNCSQVGQTQLLSPRAATMSFWLAAARLQAQRAVHVCCQTTRRPELGVSSSGSLSQLQRHPSLSGWRTFRSSCIACASPATRAAATEAEAAPMAPAAEMKSMSGQEVREAFLRFYEGHGHTRVASASLVPDDPTVLLTIAGMLPFKPIFLGQAPRQHARATSSQKCIRTNDIENVGVTARHHTFFEMLGNFSFGDYFKEQAIQMAWELSTEVFGLPQERIWVSVFEDDQEAFDLWETKVGVPKDRIRRLGAADNFWAAGPTGPCGPCSELYFDFRPELGTRGADLEDDSRFIEFYNLVFMQSNRGPDGNLTPLARQNIDTGLGLERMAQILQSVPNNYETDLILPIMDAAARLAGTSYAEADAAGKTALKVIGDHARAAVYLVSDGVLPSNVGRGYIVRRLIRRIVMKGRLLGIKDSFLQRVAEAAINLAGPCDANVPRSRSRILAELGREEDRFRTTLDSGEKVLEDVLSKAAAKQPAIVPGADAFLLYDTFGFPLEITQEAASARSMEVDLAGFETAMQEQKQRSKDAVSEVDLTARNSLGEMASELGATTFTGHHDLQGEGHIVALLQDGRPVESAPEGSTVEVVLDSTPFYAESGGQAGDQGRLFSVPAEASTSSSDTPLGQAVTLRVHDCQKGAGGNLFVHSATVESGEARVGLRVAGEVDYALRLRLRCNHTATHLLQAALKQVLGSDVSQQGSQVATDRLRFDFNAPAALKPAQLERVETLVNEWIQAGNALTTSTMGLEEAKAAGAIAMFGEKYADEVRVVSVPGVSMELCGGTHVDSTSQIGGFKILSEGGISSGVRRIEAVAGPALVDYLNSIDKVVKQLGAQFKTRAEDIPARVAALTDELKSIQKQLAEAQSQAALAKAQAAAAEASSTAKGVKVLVKRLDGIDGKSLQEAAAALQSTLGDPAAVVLLSCAGEGKVGMAAAFSPQVVKGGLQAGKFIGGIAKICGGGGGGRPNLAQAGGRDASKLDEAAASALSQLMDQL